MTATGAPHWRFRVMSPSEINENPVQGEFFGTELAKRFVRESIQNSLDARADDARRTNSQRARASGRGKPVRVRFVISGPDGALPPEQAARYLTGLLPHFSAVVDAEAPGADKFLLASRTALFEASMPFLVVEDFGTTGLLGDIRANEPQAKGNDFWGLFRSIGISPKGKDAGGSWGLGKWVFPDASKLNAFIGVTRRQDEDRLLLMGQAMLKLHKLGDQKYAPYGYFAAASDEGQGAWLPMPATSDGPHASFLEQAVADFGLHDRNQAGTSVVVPHPEDELTDPDKLAWAVITQYFWPITAGDLVVEIVAPGKPARTIDAETIGREVHNCGTASVDSGEETAGAMARAVELAAWGASTRKEDDVRTVAQIGKKAISPLDLPDVRERYERGDRLAFTVRSKVKRVLAPFRVFLEKDDTLSKGQDYFVRGYLHIPKMDYLRDYRARALTFVDNRSPLGHLLRDSEGPAHDRWNAYARRLKEKGWPAGTTRVREAQRAAERILTQLAGQPQEKQRDALADLFPSKRRGLGAKASSREASEAISPVDPVEPQPMPRVRPVRRGFAATIEPQDGLDGTAWTVRMAYDVARGSARTAFSRFAAGIKDGCPDFSLRNDRLSVEHNGCTVEVLADNELRVFVTEPAMDLQVTGFDERDLLVDVSPFEPPADQDNAATGVHAP